MYSLQSSMLIAFSYPQELFMLLARASAHLQYSFLFRHLRQKTRSLPQILKLIFRCYFMNLYFIHTYSKLITPFGILLFIYAYSHLQYFNFLFSSTKYLCCHILKKLGLYLSIQPLNDSYLSSNEPHSIEAFAMDNRLELSVLCFFGML